ncbi:MAG: hypothetical protein K0S08_2068 [Gammaproteobacteria bacterium]|jgi:hypothetical protein|nr:hypothetical protein [Gammaproteobacteria bacterium]
MSNDLISLHKAIEKKVMSIITDIAYLKTCLNNLSNLALEPPRHKRIATLNPYKGIFSANKELRKKIHEALEQTAHNIKSLISIFQDLLEEHKTVLAKEGRQKRLLKIKEVVDTSLSAFTKAHDSTLSSSSLTSDLSEMLATFEKVINILEKGYKVLLKEIIKATPSFIGNLERSLQATIHPM